MQRPVDAVLLDFDGTLVDTAPDFITALNRLLSEMGHRPVDFEDFRQLAGEGAKRLLIRALGARGVAAAEDAAAPWVMRLIEYYYEVQTVQAKPFPGVVPTLRAFRDQGLALAICTNKPDASTRHQLSYFGMTELFGAVVCGDTASAKKPDPAHLLEALAELGIEPERAVMVGDSAADVNAARAAGIAVVAVRYGYSPVSADSLGADIVIDTFGELPNALTQIRALQPGRPR